MTTTFESLPAEIAQEIFISCLDELKREVQDPEQSADAPALSLYPMLFTSICKRWTFLALACPTLWSTISVVIYHPGAEGTEFTPPLDVVGTWIERSSSAPLTFSVKHCGRWVSQRNLGHNFRYVLELFTGHHLRWNRVFLDMGRMDQTGLSLLNHPYRSVHYPELQQISLRSQVWHDDYVEADSVGLVHLLNHAPRLVAVNIDLGAPLCRIRPLVGRRALDSIHAAIPWHQLEELSFFTQSFTLLRVLEILGRDCPNLRSGSLRIRKDVDNEAEGEEDNVPNPQRFQQLSRTKTGQYPLVCHNHLLVLHIDIQPAFIDIPIIILKHTNLPKLREMNLPFNPSTHEGWKEKVLADEFENFVGRSGCELEVFHYHDRSFSEPEGAFAPPILHCLRSVSTSLRELSVEAYNTDALLKALTVRGGPESNHILCPNLDTILLKSCKYEGNGLLADMIESRWNPSNELLVERLQKVHVQFLVFHRYEPEPRFFRILTEDIPRLRALSGDGSSRKISLVVCQHENETKYV
jgi:hypothetical protein